MINLSKRGKARKITLAYHVLFLMALFDKLQKLSRGFLRQVVLDFARVGFSRFFRHAQSCYQKFGKRKVLGVNFLGFGDALFGKRNVAVGLLLYIPALF